MSSRETNLFYAATAEQVFRQQKSLTSLAVGPMEEFQLKPQLVATGRAQHLFNKLKTLEIPHVIGGVNDLEAYQHIIANAPLKDLAIRTASCLNDLDRPLADSKDSDGLLSQMLFSHLKGCVPEQRIQLEELLFQSTEFTFSERSFLQYIDCTCLRRLDLSECEGAAHLIRCITSEFKAQGSQLQTFVFDPVRTTTLNAKVLDEFLQSFRGLKTLAITGVEWCPRPDLDRLENHGHTLEEKLFKPAVSGRPDTNDKLNVLTMDASFHHMDTFVTSYLSKVFEEKQRCRSPVLCFNMNS